ncbi:MAG: hypothetical protein H7844_05275 [Nitrospirae bacterium YQR-1]
MNIACYVVAKKSYGKDGKKKIQGESCSKTYKMIKIHIDFSIVDEKINFL